MKTLIRIAIIPFIAILLSSCYLDEDPGPIQQAQQDYFLVDFDRLEMGNAFDINVQQSQVYSIKIEGDRRNLDDLRVDLIGNTLRIEFDNNRNRKHTTHITITMPDLTGVHFSGASKSTVSGFKESGEIEYSLSGASISQLSGFETQKIKLYLTGASNLTAHGSVTTLSATISGASVYNGFGLETEAATVDASGASKANLVATSTLKATASGASFIRYRGNPSVTSSTSGASFIQAD